MSSSYVGSELGNSLRISLRTRSWSSGFRHSSMSAHVSVAALKQSVAYSCGANERRTRSGFGPGHQEGHDLSLNLDFGNWRSCASVLSRA
jgi:hypothetical protein